MIAKLLAANGLVATVWKECDSYKDLPEVAIIMVDYDADWEVGRCALYHRGTASDGKTAQPYVVDPYQIREQTGHKSDATLARYIRPVEKRRIPSLL